MTCHRGIIHGMRATILSETQLTEIAKRHTDGETLTVLGKEFSKRRSHLAGLLRDRNLIPYDKRWPPQIKAIASPTVAAYLAGLIDGEGHIGQAKGKKCGPNNWFVRIQMTDKIVIDWLMEHVGGRTYDVPYSDKRDDCKRKPTWCWYVARRSDVIAVLQAAIPYLVIKQSKAQSIIKSFQEM